MVPNSSWMTLQKSPQEFIQDNEYFLDQYAIAYIFFFYMMTADLFDLPRTRKFNLLFVCVTFAFNYLLRHNKTWKTKITQTAV